ncbi:MAG: hypothetical protein FJ306_16290 [Planctomycetes bacterium]|nr:hypothetical protein [Planctomycetota bacterium]
MLAACALTAITASVACSHLPVEPASGHCDHDVTAEFVVAADGRLGLPTSDRRLRIDALELSPAPADERFDDGGRWFPYAPGTRVAVRMRFRAFAVDGAAPCPPERALPGALSVRPTSPP